MTNTDTEYSDPLERLSAYRLGMEAMRVARIDAGDIAANGTMAEVAAQLLRAAASIPANIAEGYSRGSTPERRKFLEYALGSARECVVWYETSDHPERAERMERLTSIRRLLLTMIRTARSSARADQVRFQR